jgi:hypothetical protein
MLDASVRLALFWSRLLAALVRLLGRGSARHLSHLRSGRSRVSSRFDFAYIARVPVFARILVAVYGLVNDR